MQIGGTVHQAWILAYCCQWSLCIPTTVALCHRRAIVLPPSSSSSYREFVIAIIGVYTGYNYMAYTHIQNTERNRQTDRE